MAGLTAPRKFLKLFHPEAIPWPGSVVYNAISGTTIFQRTYEVLARDILGYCSEGQPPKQKYRNPAKPSQTWSGRGKKPAWVEKALEQGKSLKDLPSFAPGPDSP